MPEPLNEKNAELLTGHKVFSMAELRSRCEIMLENYTKTVSIEALTMSDMARKEILPCGEEYYCLSSRRSCGQADSVAP